MVDVVEVEVVEVEVVEVGPVVGAGAALSVIAGWVLATSLLLTPHAAATKPAAAVPSMARNRLRFRGGRSLMRETLLRPK